MWWSARLKSQTLYGTFAQSHAALPLSKMIRQTPGASSRQIDVNVAISLPAGSRTGLRKKKPAKTGPGPTLGVCLKRRSSHHRRKRRAGPLPESKRETAISFEENTRQTSLAGTAQPQILHAVTIVCRTSALHNTQIICATVKFRIIFGHGIPLLNPHALSLTSFRSVAQAS